MPTTTTALQRPDGQRRRARPSWALVVVAIAMTLGCSDDPAADQPSARTVPEGGQTPTDPIPGDGATLPLDDDPAAFDEALSDMVGALRVATEQPEDVFVVGTVASRGEGLVTVEPVAPVLPAVDDRGPQVSTVHLPTGTRSLVGEVHEDTVVEVEGDLDGLREGDEVAVAGTPGDDATMPLDLIVELTPETVGVDPGPARKNRLDLGAPPATELVADIVTGTVEVRDHAATDDLDPVATPGPLGFTTMASIGLVGANAEGETPRLSLKWNGVGCEAWIEFESVLDGHASMSWPFTFDAAQRAEGGAEVSVTSLGRPDPVGAFENLTRSLDYTVYGGFGAAFGVTSKVACSLGPINKEFTGPGVGLGYAVVNATTAAAPGVGEVVTVPPLRCVSPGVDIKVLSATAPICVTAEVHGASVTAVATSAAGRQDLELDPAGRRGVTIEQAGGIRITDIAYRPTVELGVEMGVVLNAELPVTIKRKLTVRGARERVPAERNHRNHRRPSQVYQMLDGRWQDRNGRWHDPDSGRFITAPSDDEVAEDRARTRTVLIDRRSKRTIEIDIDVLFRSGEVGGRLLTLDDVFHKTIRTRADHGVYVELAPPEVVPPTTAPPATTAPPTTEPASPEEAALDFINRVVAGRPTDDIAPPEVRAAADAEVEDGADPATIGRIEGDGLPAATCEPVGDITEMCTVEYLSYTDAGLPCVHSIHLALQPNESRSYTVVHTESGIFSCPK